MKTFLLLFLVSLSYSYNYEDFKQITSEQQLSDYIQSSPLNVLVFDEQNFISTLVDKQECNNENYDKCLHQRSQLEQTHK
jgi:hypothetical protein